VVRAVKGKTKNALAGEVWRLLLERSMAQFGRTSSILQPLGLTPGHMKLMLQLDTEEARPMGTLAQSFQCDASTMTWLVDRLEERGLVERRPSAIDRRVKAVALTPEGIKVKDQLLERLYQPPEEIVTLDGAVLEALLDALKQ
jgi:MarR family transcriptional regulator, organic hydroperoxide resistance regulator